MANGIAMNQNKTEVYVADMLGKSISVLERKKVGKSGKYVFIEKKKMEMASYPDNIKFDSSHGKFYVASLSSLWDMTYFYRDP